MIRKDNRLIVKKITLSLIQYIINKIVKEISPLKIIIFGSNSAGKIIKNSGLDLFIIKKRESVSNRQIRKKSIFCFLEEHLEWT